MQSKNQYFKVSISNRKMGEICEMSALYLENLKRKDALVDLGVDGLILKKTGLILSCATHLVQNTVQVPMASSFKYYTPNILLHKRSARY